MYAIVLRDLQRAHRLLCFRRGLSRCLRHGCLVSPPCMESARVPSNCWHGWKVDLQASTLSAKHEMTGSSLSTLCWVHALLYDYAPLFTCITEGLSAVAWCFISALAPWSTSLKLTARSARHTAYQDPCLMAILLHRQIWGSRCNRPYKRTSFLHNAVSGFHQHSAQSLSEHHQVFPTVEQNASIYLVIRSPVLR